MLQNLQPREKTYLKIGLGLLIAAVFYVMFLEPRYQRLSTLRQQVPAMQQDLAWMKAQIRQNQSLLGKKTPSQKKANRPLLTVIEQTSTKAGLRAQITRMQPANEGAVRIWFDDVYFDPWLKWVDSLSKQGIRVDAANVTLGEGARVNIRVTLAQ